MAVSTLPVTFQTLYISVVIDQALATEVWEGFGARFRFSGERSGPGVEGFEFDSDLMRDSDNWACLRLAAASLLFDGWIDFIEKGGGI
jgi:hypothetical protein